MHYNVYQVSIRPVGLVFEKVIAEKATKDFSCESMCESVLSCLGVCVCACVCLSSKTTQTIINLETCYDFSTLQYSKQLGSRLR